MKLFCVRHGEANSADVDPQRGLTDKGQEDIARTAQYLQEHGVHVDHIMHSGKARTEQTAAIFAKVLGVPQTDESPILLGEDSGIEPLLQMVNAWTDNTMLVGHLPFMAQLVSYLVVGDPTIFPIVNFAPGAIVCLDHYENNRWMIDWCLRPSIVANLQKEA